MAHHKRGKPKSSRAGCCCGAKINKQPGCKAVFRSMREKRGRQAEHEQREGPLTEHRLVSTVDPVDA